MKIKCVQCGKVFELNKSEIDFYKSKCLDLPKRCKSCRDKNSGKYLADYTVKHPVNLILSVLFFVICMSLVYFYFVAHSFTGGVPAALISITALLSLVFLSCYKRRKRYDVSFSNKYRYNFYDAENLVKHYYKHKDDVGCNDIESYLKMANNTVFDRQSINKTVANGDTVYYNKITGDYVVLAKAGYIRSFYKTTYKHFLNQ